MYSWVMLLVPMISSAQDTVVVCPAEFRAALQQWIDYRTAQGRSIALIPNRQSAAEIRAEIRSLAAGGALRFVLLVGDSEPAPSRDIAARNRSTPAHYAQARINVLWGSEKEIATDNYFADLNDDHVPDVATGRLAVDDPLELTRVIAKTIAYEGNRDFGPWRRQVNFVAGLGGFGALTDAALEMAAKKVIADGVPGDYATTMTYGSWRSPFCPDPRFFSSLTRKGLNDGCLFWVYIGHGRRETVDYVRVPGGDYPILATRDVARLQDRASAAIACFLSCYAGAFDQGDECLGEELLRSRKGPVAVVAGSRVTMPYAMAVLGTELLHEVFQNQPPTLGEALLAAKRRTVQTAGQSANRAAIDAVARLVSPAPVDLAAEREEHLDLINLLGDPLLRLRYPRRVEVTAAKSVAPGSSLAVSGRSPLAGRCQIDLVVRRDQLTFSPPVRKRFENSDAALREFTRVYQRANDPSLSRASVAVEAGAFTIDLPVPSQAKGPCQVRVYVEGETDFASGWSDVTVENPQSTISK